MKNILIIILSICSIIVDGQILIDPVGGSVTAKKYNDAVQGKVVASGTDTYSAAYLNTGDSNTGITSYSNISLTIQFTNANTGTSTFNLNGIGAITIKKQSGGSLVDLSANDIGPNERKDIYYDGTFWVIKGGTSSGSAFWPLSGSALGTGDVNVSGLSNTASVLWQNLNLFGTDTAKVYSFGTVKLKAPIVQLSTVPTNNDTISHILVRDNSTGQIKTRRASSVTGSGTVTSVSLSLPSIFSVSGSPVTTSGTLTGTLATQSANTFFAGPTSGGAAAPTFRTMVAADVPTLPYWPVTGTKSLTGAVTINSINDTRTLTFAGVSGTDDNTKIMGATYDNWTINSATSTSNLNRSATNFSADVNSSSGNYVNSITVDNNGAQLQSLTVTPGTGSTILVNSSNGIDLNNAVTGNRFQLDGTGVKLTLGSDATGDIPYRNSSGYLTRLGVGSNGQFLKLASGLPSYASITASDVTSGAALTKTDDTNVTLTLGGTPTTALLAATSVTVGWTGTLAYSRFVNGAGLSVVGRSANSSGVQADITGTANQVLRVNGAGTSLGFGSIDLSQSATVGSSILPVANGGTGTATGLPINSIIAATGTATVNNAANAIEWQWNTLAAGTGLKLSSSSTAAASNTNKLLELSQTGANSNSNQTTHSLYSKNTKTGGGVNIGGFFSASGGTNNYAIQVGDATVNETIRMNGTTNFLQIATLANSFSFLNSGGYGITVTSTGTNYNSQSSSIFQSQATDGNIFFFGQQGTNATTARTFAWFKGPNASGVTAYAPTTGTSVLYQLGNGANGSLTNADFQPSSGTTPHTTLLLSDRINQTGTASGDIISLQIKPTLTSTTGTVYAIKSESGRVLINGTTITASTELDIRGTGTTSSTINTRFANSSNTLLSQLTDDGTWTHSGNFTLGTAGNKFSIKEGTGGFMGQTTLVAGTKAVTVTGVTTSTRCFLQLVTPNTVASTVTYQCACTANTVTLQANIAAGTINTADVSTLNYILYEPAP